MGFLGAIAETAHKEQIKRKKELEDKQKDQNKKGE